MRTQSWVLASAFALVASVASAEPERPRIYFPRAVKRQIANVTTEDLPEPASTTNIESSTRRGLFDDLLDGVLNPDRTTTSDGARTTPADKSKGDDKKTDGGIIVGPTGIKIPGLEPRPSGKTDSDSATSTGTPKASSASSKPDAKSDTDAPTSPGSRSGSPSSSSASPSSTKLIDLNPILSSLLPDPTSSNSTEPATATATATATSASHSSASSGIIDLSSLFPPISETTTSASVSASSSESVSTTSSEPPLTPTPVPTETSTGLPASTSAPPVETSNSLLPSTPLTPIPSTTTGSSDASATNTTDATDSAASSIVSVTSAADLPITPTSKSQVPIFSTPEPEPTTLSTVGPSRVASTSLAEPTTTMKNDEDWLPTTIVQAPTSFTFVRPTAEPTGTATAIPSNIPKVILPDEPDVKQPEGTTAIQIGFLYPLNWGFVSKSGVAAAQVFKWLPDALAFAGEFPIDNVVVTKLIPLDTNSKWGYVTTIAKVYYPTDQLPGLQMQMGVANSRLYNNDKEIVNSLTANINRNIDLFGNIEEENGAANNGKPDSGSGGDSTFSDNDTGNTTAQERARTAGIAVGALSLAGLYGAAMFIVARRYKRKRQGHQRASSLTSSQASSEMRYNGTGSPALMGGALLSRDVSSYGGYAVGGRDSHGSGQSGSARTANISAPVATENSLGWN